MSLWIRLVQKIPVLTTRVGLNYLHRLLGWLLKKQLYIYILNCKIKKTPHLPPPNSLQFQGKIKTLTTLEKFQLNQIKVPGATVSNDPGPPGPVCTHTVLLLVVLF